MDESFNVKLKESSLVISSIFEEIKTKTLSSILIVCKDGKTTNGSCLLLSSISPYLADLLSNIPSENIQDYVLVLPDVDVSTITTLMNNIINLNIKERKVEKIIWSLDGIFWKKGHLNSIVKKQELRNKRTNGNYDFAEEMDDITGHIEFDQNDSNDQAYVCVKEDKADCDINGDKSEKDVSDAESLIKLENKDQINKDFGTIIKDGQPINNLNIKTYEMEDELFNDLDYSGKSEPIEIGDCYIKMERLTEQQRSKKRKFDPSTEFSVRIKKRKIKEKDPCFKPGKPEEKANKFKKESVKSSKLKEGMKTIPKHESKIGITLVHEESQDEDFKSVQEKLKTYLQDSNDIEEPRVVWCKLHGHNSEIYQLANLKNPKMVCPICQKEYPVGKMNGKLYFNHLRFHKYKILKCSCEKKDNFVDHIKLVHWGWIKCKDCEAIVEQRNFLFHLHLMHPSHGKKITCPTCIKTFTVRRFKHHMDSHIEAPPFCKLCLVKYQGKNHRNHHDQVHHIKELMGCIEKRCYFTCRTPEEMNKHTEIRHAPVKQKQFICDKCGHICTRQDYLKSHKIRMHTKTLVQCPKCPKMFNEESLRDHMRKFHAALSVCTICGAKVKKLKEHMHLHIPYDQCKFKCQECLKGFMLKTTYRNHMMNVHLKERPYKCRYGCELGYNDVSNRNQHEKRRHGQLYTKQELND